MSDLPLIPGSLPVKWCPLTEQERYNKFFALGVARLDSGSGWNIHVSDTAPTADRRGDTLWLKLSGTDPIRLYKYTQGYWAARNPIAPSNSVDGASLRWLWVGTLSNLWSLDGGSGDDPSVVAPTAFTGAMWEEDTDFAARMPLGVGTLPLSTTAVAVTGTGGVDQTVLTKAQIPPHQHKLGFQESTADGSNPSYLYGNQPDISVATRVYITEDGSALGLGDGAGAATAHNNMPPYVGVYFIKRTIREFYTSDDS